MPWLVVLLVSIRLFWIVTLLMSPPKNWIPSVCLVPFLTFRLIEFPEIVPVWMPDSS